MYFEIPSIMFGKGRAVEAGKEASAYGDTVLFHYRGGSIRRSDLYARISDSLKAAGLTVFERGGVKPNPRLPLVPEGIGLCRKEHVDIVLAVGGERVIDSAKRAGVLQTDSAALPP